MPECRPQQRGAAAVTGGRGKDVVLPRHQLHGIRSESSRHGELGAARTVSGARRRGLGINLRRLQRHQQIALADRRAEVDLESLHVAGDFGVDHHCLVCNQLGRQPQGGQRRALCASSVLVSAVRSRADRFLQAAAARASSVRSIRSSQSEVRSWRFSANSGQSEQPFRQKLSSGSGQGEQPERQRRWWSDYFAAFGFPVKFLSAFRMVSPESFTR